MPIILSEGSKEKFPPVESGVHPGVCIGVIDVGTQDTGKFGLKKKLILLFELPFERLDIPDKGNLPRVISAKFTQSLDPKSNLRAVLKSWRGRDFSDEELKAFDPQKMLGANCQVNVIHEKGNDGNTYARVSTVIPPAKGSKPLKPESKTIYFSLSDQPDLSDLSFPEEMPKWIQGLILSSQEVLNHGAQQGEPTYAPAHKEDVQEEEVPF